MTYEKILPPFVSEDDEETPETPEEGGESEGGESESE